MKQLVIHDRFATLLPEPTDEEFNGLERSVLKRGFQDPITVWKGHDIIVDGHNRYRIALKHSLVAPVREIEFEDEDEVVEWMLDLQLHRRNLNQNLRALYVGEMYNARKRRQGEHTEAGSTAHEIAEKEDLSERTVRRAAKTADAFQEADDDTKKKFKAGEISQTELVRQVEAIKPVNEPEAAKPADPWFDEFTGAVGALALKAQLQATKLAGMVADLEVTFADRGGAMDAYASGLLSLKRALAASEREFSILKRLHKAPEFYEAEAVDKYGMPYIPESAVESLKPFMKEKAA